PRLVVGRPADVRSDVERLAAGLVNGLGGLPGRVLPEVDDRDPRALAGEEERGRLADARPGAGDQGDLAVEPHVGVARGLLLARVVDFAEEDPALAVEAGQLLLLDRVEVRRARVDLDAGQ